MIKKFVIVLLLFLFIFLVKVFAQDMTDVMDYYDGEERFFKSYHSFLYKADAFLEVDELKGDDIKEAKAYFRVFYDDNKRPKAAGYYTKEYNADAGVEIVKLTQYVNQDNLPYYVVKYEYNYLESPNLISGKYFKDEAGKIVNYYRYTWDVKLAKLLKIERFGINPYLGEIELKGYSSLGWKDESLDKLVFFDKNRKKIEQYSFVDSFAPKDDILIGDPLFSIGNNRIFIANLKRYERYRATSDGNLLYYILYKREGDALREEKYNEDRILLKEKFYKSFPAFLTK